MGQGKGEPMGWAMGAAGRVMGAERGHRADWRVKRAGGCWEGLGGQNSSWRGLKGCMGDATEWAVGVLCNGPRVRLGAT